jgi:trk system potassium uptake protein TrkH
MGSARGPSWDQHLRFLGAFRRERGLLWAQLAPVLLAADRILLPSRPPTWTLAVQVGAAVLLAFAGLLLPYRPRGARVLAVLAIVGGPVPVAPLALERPELVVLGALALWGLLHLTFTEPGRVLAASSPRPSAWQTARTGSLLALGVWFVQVLVRPRLGPIDAGITAAPLLLAAITAMRWARRERERPWAVWILAAVVVVELVGAGLARAQTELALTWLALAPFATLLLIRGDAETGPLTRLVEHPARLLVATFFALSGIGTALLALPAATRAGESIGLLDAAFTAVSAVCVTGLVVLDTPVVFSEVGQVILLVLIQVGGLGIMAFYTVTFAALGRRLSLRHERAVAGAMNVDDRRQLVGSLRQLILFTLTAEAVGALLLMTAFVLQGEAWGSAIWRATFTSVSAFCNAGFALQSDSLIPYQTNPLVLHATGALIVVGGLSPAAVLAVPDWARRRRIRLQERLALLTTAALLIGGFVAYATFEWGMSLGHLGWADRLHNAFFQSITFRTAGFNSVDLAATRPATQTIMMVLMLIGGSPGGTAGGIKTTTVGVIVLMVITTLLGRRRARAYGRTVGSSTVFKAGAVITVGVTAILVALITMQLTQAMPTEVAVFEVVSALGTVGLTIGGTPLLDPIGKIIIMLCMFAGRVGPLTLFLFLTEQQHESAMIFPEERVDVG